MMTADRILKEVEKLPARDGAGIADKIMDTLDAEPERIERLWIEEAQRRREEMLSGRVQGISAEDVIEEITRRLGG